MITVVTGLPRSGTSLMMKLLLAGGMDIYANEFPVMETNEILGLRHGKYEWLQGCVNHAIKVLEPERNPLPACYDYRFIWMRRGWNAIAKSQIKCLDEFNDVPGAVRVVSKSGIDELKRRTEKGLLLVRKLGPTWCFKFEQILENPRSSIKRLAGIFTDINMDQENMREVIIKRSAACLPDIREKEWGGQWQGNSQRV